MERARCSSHRAMPRHWPLRCWGETTDAELLASASSVGGRKAYEQRWGAKEVPRPAVALPWLELVYYVRASPLFRAPMVLLWVGYGRLRRRVRGAAPLRHRAFNTGRFDLGNFVQAIWTTAHGDLLQQTNLHGEQISRLGVHFVAILLGVRAALVDLAAAGDAPLNGPGDRPRARRASGLLARAQTPALRAGRLSGSRSCTWIYPPTPVARARRVPPRRARLLAPPLRLLVPGREPARAVHRLRSSSPATTREEMPLVVAGMGYLLRSSRWKPWRLFRPAG